MIIDEPTEQILLRSKMDESRLELRSFEDGIAETIVIDRGKIIYASYNLIKSCNQIN
jgi:hypothetical protein